MTTIAQNPEMLKNLNELLQAHRSAVGQQRVFERFKALVFGEILALGRHTITQLLMGLGFTQEDWSAWYRLFSEGRFEEEKLSAALFKACLEDIDPSAPLVFGGDSTQTPRTSDSIEGVGYLRNSRTPIFKVGIHLAQRWFHGALFLPPQAGHSRALPIRFMPAFSQKAHCTEHEPRTEWQAALDFLSWILSVMRQWGDAQRRVLFVADGGYDTVDFWNRLPQGVSALIRSAKNRKLRGLPPLKKHGNRKYGEQAPTPQEFWQMRSGWRVCKLVLRGKQRQLRYRVEGPFVREGAADRPVFLLVVGGEKYVRNGREKHREPVPYLVSAVQNAAQQWELPLPIDQLLFWAWQRWELEVVHRELKSNLGLGEKQAWHPQAAVSTVQWSAWVYSVLVLAGYRTWGITGGPRTQTAWWQGGGRWSFNTLLRHYRAAVSGGHTFQASWYTIQDNLPEKIPSWLDFRNSLYGSARL